MILDELPTKSFCTLPWVSVAVGTTGHVVPCCLWMGHEKKYVIEHKNPNIESELNEQSVKTESYTNKTKQNKLQV